MCLLKECYRLAHQTHTDAMTANGWMDSYAHKIAKFILKRIELVADYFAVQFSYNKIGMGGCDILEGECIVTPEVLEAQQVAVLPRGFLSRGHRSHTYRRRKASDEEQSLALTVHLAANHSACRYLSSINNAPLF